MATKGKLDNNPEVIEKILEIAKNKNNCYGINQYNYIAYITFELDDKLTPCQWWVLTYMPTHQIRNCGINISNKEFRSWQPNNGIQKIYSTSSYNHKTLSTLSWYQNFNATRTYMNEYFLSTQDKDIGLLLTDLMLSTHHTDWKVNLQTWDPPAWQDWMAGVNKTLQDFNIDSQDPLTLLYSPEMAFWCMKNYLNIFYEEITFEGVRNILQIINSVDIGNKQDKSWLFWLDCMQAAIEQEPNIIG
ncbi:hypothetical protein KBD08_01380 [Candidatus Babeliales bacterium]|nr:hypothetical protein [Candidatus Babeliales bacterium]